MNWKDKRINEINKICSARPGAAECFIEEVHGIYESKAKSYADFQEEQEEKKSKYERKAIYTSSFILILMKIDQLKLKSLQ